RGLREPATCAPHAPSLHDALPICLTGLPPTPEETDAFAADPSPDAYERLVDRGPSVPRTGERWARHWLDVVHYGETHGYDKDKRSAEHTSELQSLAYLVCRLLNEK